MQKDENEIGGTAKEETEIHVSEKNEIEIHGSKKDKSEIKIKCKYCSQPINAGAKICYHCGKHQNRAINFLGYLATFTALVMVFIAGYQVKVNLLQMEESKKKRVEAESVLKQANQVLLDATSKSEEIREQAELTLSDSRNVLTTANKVSLETKDEANKVLSIVRDESKAAIEKANEARKEFDKASNDVRSNLKESNDRMTLTEKIFRQQFNNLKSEYEELKKDVLAELTILKERNQLVALADNAISKSDGKSLDELQRITQDINEPPNKRAMARAEMFRVKSFYIGSSRISGVEIKSSQPGPRFLNLEEKDIPADILIEQLLTKNNDWKIKAKVAQLLGKHKEKKVPEVLLQYMQTEKNLDIRKECIASFCRLTGMEKRDIVDVDYIPDWWQKNKERVESKLEKK